MVWVLGILLAISLVFGGIQLKARIKHENVLIQMMYKIETTLGIMQKLDLKGAFEAHDVVGQTFMLLTVAIEELRNYFIGKLNQKDGSKKGK